MRTLDALKKTIGTLAVLLLVLPGAAAANDQIAEVQNFGDTLVFTPIVEFRELVLTVTGPCGFEYRQVVEQGDLVFRLDATTIDGAYRYNLFREEPIDPAIIEILQQARAKFDDETPKQLCRAGKLPGPPQVQAAGFQVFRGAIVYDPGSVEKSLRGDGDVSLDELLAMKPDIVAGTGNSALPTKDFVIIDDLIVDGSACIGFDCVNGESFGFDTIRLKENNLRIKFDDTSTVASFPRNDWQLTANDSANGGASKFSIDDISGSRTPFTVEANARSHSLYVDDGGRIGSRTSTPSVEIHTIDGDTPTLRLQQDGSSGFAPQTWDVAGNETNFFVRDVTNGSTLPLRIRPGAPSSSILIDVDGNVGLRTSSPDTNLHIVGLNDLDDHAEILLETAVTGQQWMWRANNATGEMNIVDNTGTVTTPLKIAADSNTNLLRLGNGATDRVDVTGRFFINGTEPHPDFVFEPDYELESIEEHGEFMWTNKHLPAVGTGGMHDQNGKAVIDVGQRSQGILEELEKAHIYIEQLHQRLARLEALLRDEAAE